MHAIEGVDLVYMLTGNIAHHESLSDVITEHLQQSWA